MGKMKYIFNYNKDNNQIKQYIYFNLKINIITKLVFIITGNILIIFVNFCFRYLNG